MNVIFRRTEKKECPRIAQLDNIASDGAIELLFHDLIPNMTPEQIVASNLASDSSPYSYQNVIIAEHDNEIIGMSLSFPGKYHRITKQMTDFFPEDRVSHFRYFFSAPVHDSYYLDALCVDEKFRGRGIGSRLIELTKEKAVKEGFETLALLTFRDNAAARQVYEKNGFETVDQIQLNGHWLMPHEGGCLLMKVTL
jgi:ribosomal protein S18 acetylase RimI-like enzyme